MNVSASQGLVAAIDRVRRPALAVGLVALAACGLGWFLAISGGIVLFLTLGCILAVSDGKPFSEDGMMGLVCGSPTLLLGGLFLWLGTRRLKR